MKFILILLFLLLSQISAKNSKNFFTEYVYSGHTDESNKYQIASVTVDAATGTKSYHNQINENAYHFLIKNSKYRLIRLLSCGGNGCIYIIEKKALPHTRLVLKLAADCSDFKCSLHDTGVNPGTKEVSMVQIAQEVLAKQKQNECKNVMKIKHVIPFLDHRMAMTLELIDGTNLHNVIHDPNSIFHPVPAASAKRDKECLRRRKVFSKIASNIVSGMECIHSKYQMWHFDIKTQNIMINQQNQALIIDIDGIVTEPLISNPSVQIATTPGVSPEHVTHTPGSEDPKPARASADYMDWNKRYDDFTIGMVLCKMLIAVTNGPTGAHRHPNAFLQMNEQVKGVKRFNLDQLNKDDRDFCLNANNNLGNGLDYKTAEVNKWKNIVVGLLQYNRTNRMQLAEAKRIITEIRKAN